MLSRAESLYARLAIVRAEVAEIAEGLGEVAEATYKDTQPARAVSYRRTTNAQAMIVCAEIDSMRDTAYRLARADGV